MPRKQSKSDVSERGETLIDVQPSLPSTKITFGRRLTLGAMEQLIQRRCPDTLKSTQVYFDLSGVQFVGHFPATLLYSWCALLSKRKTEVTFTLPDLDSISPQVDKALLGCGVLARIKDLGIALAYAHESPLSVGIPLQLISERAQLWTFINSIARVFLESPSVSPTDADVIYDALDVVLFELGENAFIHADGSRPHLQMTISESTGGSGVGGVITQFPSGTKYVEICLGDLGSGIDRRLEKEMPCDYQPVFCPRRPTHAQRVVSYAFEFSSTSDRVGRRARIEDLLGNDELDPDGIASGLFSVLEVVRYWKGQLVIRTSRAILSIDFYRNSSRPTLKGHRDLLAGSLGSFFGSHFLVRLPLGALRASIKSVTAPRNGRKRAEFVDQISVLSAFRGARDDDTPADVIHRAAAEVDRHFNSHRSKPGLTVVMPAPALLPNRAISVFLGALRAIPHGNRTVIWLESRTRHISLVGTAGKKANRRRARPPGQAVLIADLVTNELHVPFGGSLIDTDGIVRDSSSLDTFHFESRVFKTVQSKYAAALQDSLASLLKAEAIRHHPGPFLIADQYYRDTYFEIPVLVADIAHQHLLAEWLFRRIPGLFEGSTPDILIGTTYILREVLQILSELVYRATTRKPIVVCRERNAQRRWLLQSLLTCHGKNAVVVTDIISRGVSIESQLRLMTGISITVILAIVDARTEHNGDPFVVHGDEPFSIPLRAVVSEPIPTYRNAPPRGLTVEGEERVVVIDPETKAPTVYVRRTQPQTSLLDQLQTTVRQSRSLICGHTEFQSKHYSNYLHFPRLFAALKPEIFDWIRNQVSAVSAEMGEYEHAAWHANIYDPDGGLAWLAQHLGALPQSPAVSFVSRDQLEAPPPPRDQTDSHSLFIVPAMASGEIARRSIEFASRFAPRSILLLVVLSRMEPKELAFFAQIQTYGGVRCRLGVCFEFPLSAYSLAEGYCPLCRELDDLIHLSESLRQSPVDVPHLAQSVSERITGTRPLHVESLALNDEPPPVSDGDMMRTRLLALYQQALIDQTGAKMLTNLLMNDQKQMDYFLEVVSAHRRGTTFSLPQLERRLSAAFEPLCERVRCILRNESAPFPIHRVIRAIAHMFRESFVERSTNLLERFGDSRRDIESICVELVLVGVMPRDAAVVPKTLREGGRDDAAVITSEAINYLQQMEKPDEARNEEQMHQLFRLWAKLVRSSQFVNTLNALVTLAKDSEVELVTLFETGKKLVADWRKEVLPSLNVVRTARIWMPLARDRGNGPLEIEPLENCIQKVGELVNHLPQRVRNNKGLRTALEHLGRITQVHIDNIDSRIELLFGNVLNCDAANLPPIISDIDGSPINIRREVDQSIDLAFCEMNELNIVASEIIKNWQEYAKDCPDRHVTFKVFQTEKFVVLEFADPFPGTIDGFSFGGILTAKEFCRQYCGVLELSERGEDGQKSIKVMLRRLARAKTR